MIKENPLCETECVSSGKLIHFFFFFVAWSSITLSLKVFKSHIQYHCTYNKGLSTLCSSESIRDIAFVQCE